MSLPEIQLLYDAATIRQKVGQLGRRIEREHGEEDLQILSIVGGSVIFLADLIRSVRQPVRFEFVQVRYTPSAAGGEVLDIQYPIPMDVEGQSLMILKDVVGTAVIETYLRNQFLELGAAEVRFAALIDVPELRRSHFSADYSLFTPKRTGTFVGYGLKYRSRYGNLAYIGRLVEP